MNKSKFRDHNNIIMGADSGGEAIIICIDNTIRKPDYYQAQLEAVRSYATYKIQSHPRTVVGISTMSRSPIHNPSIKVVLDPTRDLNKIFDSFQCIVRSSELDITETIFNCLFMLSSGLPKRVQKRIVMFAGGIINMGVEVAIEFGKGLKKKGIAVDVVNFTLGDELDFRKKKLEAFVAAVNNNNNSHIIHVDEGSSLSNLLSSFMSGDEHVEAKGMTNKYHPLIHSKTSSMKKKAKENENVDVKREPEPSSSFMAKGMKNKDHQLIHSKTSRLSALFDMLETNIPRERSERMLPERELFGREALSVIAREG